MGKKILPILVVFISLSFNNQQDKGKNIKGPQAKDIQKPHKVAYAVEPLLERLGAASFELEGRQDIYQKAVTQNWLLGLTERNPYMLGMFEENNKQRNGNLLPWSGEFAGKHLTGAVALYRLHRDPKLKQMLDDFVSRLCALQTPTGYLGPWPEEFELTCHMPGNKLTWDSWNRNGLTWDSWNHYFAMIGLLEYHRLEGDTLSLGTCRRIGDRLCTEFLDQPDKLIRAENTKWDSGCMEVNLTPAHSLCQLYRATGETKYLELAIQMTDQGFLRHGDYLNRALAGKEFYQNESSGTTRWERLHAIMALAELYWLTGIDDYRKAFEQIWWSIAKTDIHNTGGFSTDEAAKGDPYADGRIETCCTVAWQALSVEMLKMTANPIIADMLEIAQINAAYGSWDISGSWSTYHTTMVGERYPNTMDLAFQRKPGTEQLNCCSVNAPRGIGILSDWAIMGDGTGFALNWYGPDKVTANVNEVPVTFTQATDYPNSGTILIHVDPQSSGISFPLKLRIPFWSEKTTVEVNGKVVRGVKAGSYLRLDREWHPGDKIRLELDMRPHIWPGQNQYVGFGSIYHGPVLLALRKPNEPLNIVRKEGEWNHRDRSESYRSKTVGPRLVGEFTGEKFYMVYDQCPDGGQTRLQIDGKDIGIIDHYAPALTPLTQWQSPMLKPGKHEFVLEILKEAHPASKGHGVRIREFRLGATPVLDARTLQISSAQVSPAGVPWLHFTASDAQGRKIELEDFDSAGKNSGYYYTWLPLEGLDKSGFSYSNPMHSVHH